MHRRPLTGRGQAQVAPDVDTAEVLGAVRIGVKGNAAAAGGNKVTWLSVYLRFRCGLTTQCAGKITEDDALLTPVNQGAEKGG